jgi:hypothetical protein
MVDHATDADHGKAAILDLSNLPGQKVSTSAFSIKPETPKYQD